MHLYSIKKNYKYTKSLFLNTLKCNHLSTKTKTKKNNVFFNTKLVRILFYFLFFFKLEHLPW